MGVGELWSQPVDIRAAALQREVPQHVIERAVLHHQHDDVLNLRQVRGTGPLDHHNPPLVRTGSTPATSAPSDHYGAWATRPAGSSDSPCGLRARWRARGLLPLPETSAPRLRRAT